MPLLCKVLPKLDNLAFPPKNFVLYETIVRWVRPMIMLLWMMPTENDVAPLVVVQQHPEGDGCSSATSFAVGMALHHGQHSRLFFRNF